MRGGYIMLCAWATSLIETMMDLLKLNDIINRKNFKFKKLDYLYLRSREGYPLKKEFDIDNYFFVIDNSIPNEITVNSLGTKEKKILKFSDLKGNWWFFRMPHDWRKSIGIES